MTIPISAEETESEDDSGSAEETDSEDDSDSAEETESEDDSDSAEETESEDDSDSAEETKTEEDAPLRASPLVRRRARALDVDLEKLASSSGGGRVTVEQVERAGSDRRGRSAKSFEGDDDVTIEKMSSRRKATARMMAEAWRTIPHVTQHDMIDVTALEEARRRYEEGRGEEEIKLSLTAFVAKACVATLGEHPRFNASLVEDDAVALKRSIHLAIAVDTPSGLVAPVVHDSEKASLRELAEGMAELVERARTGSIPRKLLRGGTFSISNVGAIGGGHFTPIITPPQVAVLGLGRTQSSSGRWYLPVSLSYDHRVVDGADAARFIVSLGARLREPMRLMLDS